MGSNTSYAVSACQGSSCDAQFARCTAFRAHPSRLGCQHVTPCRYLYVGRAPTLGEANRMKHAALLAVHGSQVSPQLLTMDVSNITGKQGPASCVQGARYVGWPLGRRHTLCQFKGEALQAPMLMLDGTHACSSGLVTDRCTMYSPCNVDCTI
jgi:hypothetical protein